MSAKEDKPQTAAEMVESVVAFVRRSLAFWRRSLLVFIVVTGIGVPYVFLKPRAYRSETVVLYQENIKAEALTGADSSNENARRVGARLKEMLLARASLEPIVKDLPRYAALAERRGMVDAVEELRTHISFHAREGDTFEIGYEGQSAQEAQDVTRRLGDRIVQEAAARRAEQSKATTDYLEAQSNTNKEKLRKAEEDLWSFLAIHPEFIPLTLPGGGQKTVVVMPGGATATGPTRPTKDDPVLAALQAEERNLETRIRAGKGEAPAPAPPREDSADVIAARKELADKRAMYTEQHPDVVAAKRRLQAAIEADQAKAAGRSVPIPTGKLTDAEIQALEQRLSSVRRSIAAHQARNAGRGTAGAPAPSGTGSAAAVALEVEFRRLQREVDNLKDVQKQLDDKLFKAGLNEGANLSDRNVQVKILDAAYLPAHPSSKPRSTALAINLFVALALAIILALVSARLDDRIYHRRDLEILDILPVMGVIPHEDSRKRRS